MTTISQNNGKVTTTVEEESPLEKSRRTLANLRDKIAAEEARKAKEKTRQEREKSEEFLRQRLQDAARQRANVASSLEETTTLVEEMAKTWREARALGLHEEPEVEAIGQEIVNLREKQEALRKELTTAIATHEEAKRKLEAVVAAKQPTVTTKATTPVTAPMTQQVRRSNDEINWGETSAQLAIEQAETPTLELVLAMCAEATLPRHLQGIGGYIRSLPAEERHAAKQAQDEATTRISALYYARQVQANPSQQPAKVEINLDEIRREIATLRTELAGLSTEDSRVEKIREILKEAEYKASFDKFPSRIEEALTLARQGRAELRPILEEVRRAAKARRAANLAERQMQGTPKGPSPSADKYGKGGKKALAKAKKTLNRRRAGK